MTAVADWTPPPEVDAHDPMIREVELGQAVTVDAEQVEVEAYRQGGPIDADRSKEPRYAVITGLAEQDRAPIIPAWMRNRSQRWRVPLATAGFALYVLAFHLLRLPKYMVLGAAYAPRGGWRLGAALLSWLWVTEQLPLRLRAVQRLDTETWIKLHKEVHGSRKRHAWIVAGGLVAVVVVLALGWRVGGAAALWLSVLAALAGAARAGAPVDRPLIDRVTTSSRFTRLTAEAVRLALVQLAIPGLREPAALTFPPPGIHRDGPGWLARVNLPGGVTAVKVLERREELSSALRLPMDQIWPAVGPAHAGQLDLWVGNKPASQMGNPRWSVLNGKPLSFFEPAPFAFTPRTDPAQTVLFQRNFLLGGQPGSGKSFAARGLATIALLDPLCEVQVAEFKGVGDFLDLEPLCSRYVVGTDDQAFDDGADMVRWLFGEVGRRGAVIKAMREQGRAPEGKVTPELAAIKGLGLHPLVVVLDEIHELLAERPEVADMLTRIIKRGRALAVVLVLATQIPDAKTIPSGLTKSVSSRWCFSVLEQVANDQILGTGSYKRGQTGTVYRPVVDAGWGYAKGFTAEDGPVRSPWLTPEQWAAVTAVASALRGGRRVGADDGPVAGEVFRRDLIEDALAVVGQANGSHWLGLVEGLAALDAESYGDLDPESVGAMLRALGVETGDVKVSGVTRKGVKRRALEAARERRAVTAGAR
ncbi:FtsK/SpoIIIE domain-containing protein [Virgisporangium ochraceum]|uniref:Cell division protein FtsK n=1 Tax=Virgisporangium ochraceum TaxID=65505 RepID=A0A8J3ZUH9_9ACTN|nr:AAA family ATPase [Virgisporangium ochraceum]GIJ69886.1 cell division protein FtsK [Virgisporangium ochraceum]